MNKKTLLALSFLFLAMDVHAQQTTVYQGQLKKNFPQDYFLKDSNPNRQCVMETTVLDNGNLMVNIRLHAIFDKNQPHEDSFIVSQSMLKRLQIISNNEYEFNELPGEPHAAKAQRERIAYGDEIYAASLSKQNDMISLRVERDNHLIGTPAFGIKFDRKTLSPMEFYVAGNGLKTLYQCQLQSTK